MSGLAEQARKLENQPGAEQRNGVSKNIVFSTVGQGIYLLTQLFVLSSLAHMRGLTAVGEFGLALAVATPTFVFLGQGVRILQVVDAPGAHEFAEYVGARLLGVTAAAAVTIAIGTLIDAVDSEIIVAVALMKCAEAASEATYGVYQKLERLQLQARSLILRGVAGALLFYLLLAQGSSVGTALYAQVIVWGSVAVLVDYRAASRMSVGRVVVPNFSPYRSAKILLRAFPVSSESLIINLQKSGQRYVVGLTLGLRGLGTFTAIEYVHQAGVMLANAISHPLLGRLAYLRTRDQHRSANKIVIIHAAVMLLIAIIGVHLAFLLAAEVVKALLDVESQEAELLLVLVAVAVGIRMVTTAPASGLYAAGQFRNTMIVQSASSCVALGLAGLLVPMFGLAGAGYALVAAAVFRSLAIVWLYVLTVCRRDRGPNLAEQREAEELVAMRMP